MSVDIDPVFLSSVVTINIGQDCSSCNYSSKLQCFLFVMIWHCKTFKIAFHLPKLADQTNQSVNRMRHFEGMVPQNLEIISENGSPILKKFVRPGYKLSFKLVHSFSELADLAGQF